MRNRIAIIGAGIAGLTAALALLRDGWRVRVYEQAPVLGEVGAGITLSAGAGNGLAALGLGEKLLAASLPVPDIAFVHFSSGELLAGSFDNTAPEDFGFARARHIHRADLHGILLAGVRAMDPEAVVTGAQMVAIQVEDGVTAHFADGATAAADALIAADGARSTVRRLVLGDDIPAFAGQIAFRCLISRADAAPFMGAGNAVVSIGAGRIFNRYVIRGGDLVNVIGIARSDRWRQEGWSTPATPDEFAAEFAGFHTNVLGLIRRAPEKTLIKWGLFARPRVKEWSRGRVLLIGDAAHPMLPFLGLGAATAIEDGIMLARALALTPDIASAFGKFQRSRAGRVETVRTESIRQGEIIQAAAPDSVNLRQSPSHRREIFSYDPLTAPIEGDIRIADRENIR